jgi:phage gp46-like protein
MSDIKIQWDPINGRGDWVVVPFQSVDSVVVVDEPVVFGEGDGETLDFKLWLPNVDVIPVVSANIYRTDWQGRQLLYATPRTNLLQQSSNFASWGNFGGAPTGSMTGPDGVSTVDVFVESADNTNHFTDRADAVITSGSTNTLSVLAAQAGRRYLQLGLDDGAGLNGIYATFDLQAGVVTQALTLGAGVVVDTNIAKLPAAGWYQLSISGSCAEVTAVRTFFLLSELPSAGVAPGYMGDGVSGVAMFDAQLEPGSVATSRIPTTTAPVTVTDYVLGATGEVTLASAPAAATPSTPAAILDWTGSYLSQQVSGGYLETGDDLETALLLSLFTDREAAPDDIIPDGSADRRGWWGDDYSDDDTGPTGSRLWLLSRRKSPTNQTLTDAYDYAAEAIQWLIDTGIVGSFVIVTQWVKPDTLGMSITPYQPDGTALQTYNWAWPVVN